jgi:uncharacterized membrane protein YkoI
MRYRTTMLALFSFLLAAGLFGLPAVQSTARAHEDHDEDRARHALEAGEVMALDRVLAALRDAVPGEISSIELERERGIWVYEFMVISREGNMLKVRVDAKTGKLIKPEG